MTSFHQRRQYAFHQIHDFHMHSLLFIRTLLGNFISIVFQLFLPLLLSLSFELLNLFWWAVLNQIRHFVDATPLGQAVWDVHNPLAVEHMATRFEVSLVFFRLEVNQGRKKKDHIATFVHDRRMAVRAANLAGKLVFDGLVGGIIPFQIVVAISEVDVFLVENGSPLERRSCNLLVHQTCYVLLIETYRAASGR